MSEVVTIVGREQIMAMLDKLAGPESRKVLGQAMKDLAKPQLARAKELTPVLTGRLRASLGIASFKDKAEGTVDAIVGPRRDFNYATEGGLKMSVRSSVAKRQNVRLTGKRKVDYKDPTKYAYFIEFGETADGMRKRRAGPAHMLKQSYDETRAGVLKGFGEAVNKRIAALNAKKGT